MKGLIEVPAISKSSRIPLFWPSSDANSVISKPRYFELFSCPVELRNSEVWLHQQQKNSGTKYWTEQSLNHTKDRKSYIGNWKRVLQRNLAPELGMCPRTSTVEDEKHILDDSEPIKREEQGTDCSSTSLEGARLWNTLQEGCMRSLTNASNLATYRTGIVEAEGSDTRRSNKLVLSPALERGRTGGRGGRGGSFEKCGFRGDCGRVTYPRPVEDTRPTGPQGRAARGRPVWTTYGT